MELIKLFRIELFDLVLSILVAFSVLGFLISIYISNIILGIITVLIFVVFSLVIGGRVVAPYYLDAHAIHLLRRHKGKMQKYLLTNYYDEDDEKGGLKDTITRLSHEGYVRIYDNEVVLAEQYLSSKLKNFLSNWAMKGIVKRAKKNQ